MAEAVTSRELLAFRRGDEVYFRELIDAYSTFGFVARDVEGTIGLFFLRNNDYVLCHRIVFRKGGKGRGRYARLVHMRDGKKIVLFHRVSKNNIGSGNWEELNEMLVLALADEITPL